jgi:hypothetical protein
MEININCIKSELDTIIKNYKKYSNKIILHTLASLELIAIIKKTQIITYDFIKTIRFLSSYMNCYIDINLFDYACNNNKKVILYDNSINFGDICMTDSDSSYDKLTDKIENMLINDALLLNDIIEKDNNFMNKDEYGNIDSKVISLSKKLFNILDKDKNGLITPLDLLNIIDLFDNDCLIFEYNFIDNLLQSLITQNFIDFDLFFNFLF